MKIEFDTQEYCYVLPDVGVIFWLPGLRVVRAWWLRFSVTVTL